MVGVVELVTVVLVVVIEFIIDLVVVAIVLVVALVVLAVALVVVTCCCRGSGGSIYVCVGVCLFVCLPHSPSAHYKQRFIIQMVEK